jgi:hypothetical protein
MPVGFTAPESFMSKMLTLRVHLDPMTPENLHFRLFPAHTLIEATAALRLKFMLRR